MSEKLFHILSDESLARESLLELDSALKAKLGETEETITCHGGLRSKGLRALVSSNRAAVNRSTGEITLLDPNLYLEGGKVFERGSQPRKTWAMLIPLKTGEYALLHCPHLEGEALAKRALVDRAAARALDKAEIKVLDTVEDKG